MAKLKLSPSGPAVLSGPMTVVDARGQVRELGEGERIALCRCGNSSTYPVCDGTHNRQRFRDDGCLPETDASTTT